MVPLVGENRSLVKRGLAEMRRTRQGGLRALMEAAKCEPTRLDEGDLAFRLAPRINAAGRLYRADAGVELLLTEDEERAQQIADELGRANCERRAREREVDTAAEAARRELPERLREAPGLVLAGEGWHPGVVGIVASRLVERHHRPVVVISLDGEGGGRGSGRSIPGFDLLAALEACSEHLVSFGGHRAAAGLSLRAEDVDAFREAFAAHAGAVLGPEDLRRTERIDAMVGGVGLGLDLAEELGQLAPFGMGNPGVRLMVPSARVSDVRTMGEGKHARFSLHSGAHRALGVAFGRSSLGVGDEDPVDAAVRLEVNHWNGSVEPRVVLRELYPLEDATAEPPIRAPPLRVRRNGVVAALRGRAAPATSRRFAECVDFLGHSREVDTASARSWPATGSATARIAELVSSGAGVLAVCADASRRAALAGGRHRSRPLQRRRRPDRLPSLRRRALEALVDPRRGRPRPDRLRDAGALRRAWPRRFEHVVLVDPPPSAGDELRVGQAAATAAPASCTRSGARPSASSRSRSSTSSCASRQAVATSSARLREAGEASGPELREALAGSGAAPARARGRRPLLPRPRRAGAGCGRAELAARASSGSYPQRGRIWSARPRSAPTAQTTRRHRHTSKDPNSRRAPELLADLFAVVEEFDSSPSAENGNGAGGTAPAVATIDRAALERAFDFACDRHADQLRHSGDEFITHPVGVAQICAGMRLDTETLCAALLHDTVEDTSASLEEIREEFGEEIAQLVDGVTKLTGMTFESRDERQAENYRKMMVAMATDVRVILIKLADRLHNMRTLGALPKQKQMAKSHETLEIYAPLAHRLGIHAIKWELEDLAFATLHPRKYAEIKQLVAQQRDEREIYVTDAGEFLSEELEQVGIEAEISGRAKHFYSIYTKMAKKGREFNEIFDLTAMRVIVGSVKDCYGAIGVIHSLWKPLPGRFKDFVAMPKANMYQALHTTVIGPEGKPLEIQIRTEEMHKLAEYGIAAHVAYKEGGGGDPKREKMTWLRQLVEAEGEQDPAEFLESLKVDLFEDEVFVFTPKGEVKNLSAGSTPLDFAYAVHTDVGHRCVGAKVNGIIVPLHYQLRSGDIVEVLTAKQKRGPSRDWLKLVRTSRARNKIRAFFKEERREDAERKGRERPRGSAAHARPADAEGRRLGAARRRHPRDGLPQRHRLLHRPRPGQGLDQDRRQQADAAAEGGRGGRGAPAARSATAARTAPAAPRTPPTTGSGSRAPTTSPCGSPSAAGRCPATRSPATSRSAAGSPSTAPTART